MKIATYNIQGCARGVDWVGGAIRDLAADVICLQEVHRKHLRRLAAIAGRRAAFCAGGRMSGFGNAILSREQPRIVLRHRFRRMPGLEPRALLVCRSGDLLVGCTHLGLVGEERLAQAREIEALLPGLPGGPGGGPFVLAGDMNEGDVDPAIMVLASLMNDAFVSVGTGDGSTFPSQRPDRRIDYILYRGLTSVSAEVMPVLASDHRALIAEFEPIR